MWSCSVLARITPKRNHSIRFIGQVKWAGRINIYPVVCHVPARYSWRQIRLVTDISGTLLAWSDAAETTTQQISKLIYDSSFVRGRLPAVHYTRRLRRNRVIVSNKFNSRCPWVSSVVADQAYRTFFNGRMDDKYPTRTKGARANIWLPSDVVGGRRCVWYGSVSL